MTRTIRHTAAVATLLVAVGFALPARADHDAWPVSHGPLPPPAAYPAGRGVVPAPGPAVVLTRPGTVYIAPYRLARWREGPAVRELREEYRHLDVARDRFYATWDGRPWTRDRFESWYASRRSELDHRWFEVTRWGDDHR